MIPYIRSAIATIALVMFGCVLAQEVTGTITGYVDGSDEARLWYTLGIDTDEGYQATADWTAIMDSLAAITVQGHSEERFATEGALSFEFTSFGGFPTDCPCTFDDASFTYWTTSSFMNEFFTTDEATVTIETAEEVEENVYRIEGSFEAILHFQESATSGPDPERTMAIHGTFTVERLPEFVVE